MEQILSFIKVVFFGNTVLLNSAPVNLDEQWNIVRFENTVEAITIGAAVQIRISRVSPLFVEATNSTSTFEVAQKVLPEGTIEAILFDENGIEYSFSKRQLSIARDYVSYGLRSESPIPTGVLFTHLKIRSEKRLENIEVYWKNFSN
ncbi:MAG: hypothetical protein AAF387_00935 [Pseudomonadota bacterium]